MRGNAAGQRSIIVDVELKKVEKRVVNGFEGAINVFFNSKIKLERPPSLIACHERDVLKLTLIVCDMLASVNGPVQTADRYCVTRRIAGLLFSFIWAGSFGNTGEEK